MTITMIDDLFRHDEWANQHLLRMCAGLTDAQLDQPREMGFGTLRATLFHILAAEEIWLERWTGQPWRPFPFEPQGTTLDEIAGRLNAVSVRRRQLLDDERASQWQREVSYLDSKQNAYVNKLENLLIHVANHGIHHRAQALHYLKHFGRTLPVGLDYTVYKLAYSTVKQEDATVAAMRNYGLEVELGEGTEVEFNAQYIQNYFAYHDWATRRVLNAAMPLDGAALDKDFGIGPGCIRRTLLHLFDVEPWWMKNWSGQMALPDPTPMTTPLPQLQGTWSFVAGQRNAFIKQLDAEKASRIVSVTFGGPPVKFRVIESLIQICVHGTHHRAQLVNMLRHSGIEPPALDYSAWSKGVS